MPQIADWLEKLGLGGYARRFVENDISFGVLPDLTDQDLKDLGVSLGHRRQLQAIFRDAEGSSPDQPLLVDRAAPPFRDSWIRFFGPASRGVDGQERRRLLWFARSLSGKRANRATIGLPAPTHPVA